jgi:hypothetical protein
MKSNQSEKLLDAIGLVSDDKIADVGKLLDASESAPDSAVNVITVAAMQPDSSEQLAPIKRRSFPIHLAGLAAAMLVLAVGTVVMLRVLAPEPEPASPPPDWLGSGGEVPPVEPVIVFNGVNRHPLQRRSFDLPSISEHEIENLPAETILAIAHGRETDFVFPEHHWLDDFGVPLQVGEPCPFSGEHEEIQVVFASGDSRETVEQNLLRDFPRWNTGDVRITDLRLEYVGENDYYFAFRLRYTYRVTPELERQLDWGGRLEAHTFQRVIVFKSDIYNGGGFTSATCAFEPFCICDECVPRFSYFPQESRNFETILHVLDLHTFNLALYCESGSGRIIHRTLEETEDRFIYTFYRVAEESNGRGGTTGGAFMEMTRNIIFKDTGYFNHDPGHYEFAEPRRINADGSEAETRPPYEPSVRVDVAQFDNVELYNNPRGRITVSGVDPECGEQVSRYVDLAEAAQAFLLRTLSDFDSEPIWRENEWESETAVRFFDSGAVLNQVARIYVSEGWHSERGEMTTVQIVARFDNSPCTRADGHIWHFSVWYVEDGSGWEMINAEVNAGNAWQLYALFPENESMNPISVRPA